MNWILDFLFGKRVARDTARYLDHLSKESEDTTRQKASRMLRTFESSTGPHVQLGTTDWGVPVKVPILELLRAHSLVTGSTGSGKSMFALIMMSALMKSSSRGRE